jgi:uncharacterized membrane protein YfcA
MLGASIALGALAGAQHALSGPDHLAGVAPFAAARGRSAWRVGLAWGLGHALGACLAALAALALRDRMPGIVEQLSRWSEMLVGLVLCVVGAFGLHGLLRERASPAHVHDGPQAGTRCFGLGLLHGAAGLSHLYAVLPALALPAPGGYLAAYALTSTCAMALLAGGCGRLSRGAGRRRWTLGLSSAASLLVGAYWVHASW